MINSDVIYKDIINILDKNKIDYKLFTHKSAFSYEELAEVQKQIGFFGTEMKCLVLNSKETFLVYVTIQGNKLNFNKMKEFLKIKELRLATTKELAETFGAKPGCAYPFGFSDEIPIFIDPLVYNQEHLLFSPILPTKTIQISSKELKRVFSNIQNKITEINFNL